MLFDSFWRAVAYCLHPRVILLSLAPVILMGGLTLAVGYHYWDPALAWVLAVLDASSMVTTLSDWMQSIGLGNLKSVLVPLIVIFTVTPAIVVLSLLLVAVLMSPAMTELVARKRFGHLERRQDGSLLVGWLWSLLSTVLALVALVVSLPLWLIPPLILILPPLIWGWLTYRVLAFDALAAHASGAERKEIFRRHRMTLLGIGIFCGYLGAAPSLIWASGALMAAAFVVLVPLAVWLYTLVFAFCSLWFSHFCLAALQALRAEADAAVVAVEASESALLPASPALAPLTHEPSVAPPYAP